MVDRSREFASLLSPKQQNKKCAGGSTTSPYVIFASDLLSKIISMESILVTIYCRYVGYHVHFTANQGNKVMPSEERITLDQCFATFIETCGSEIRELRQRNGGNSQHYNEIFLYLIERLKALNRIVGKMQAERRKYSSRNPFKLLTGSGAVSTTQLQFGKPEKQTSRQIPLEASGQNYQPQTLVQKSFSDRYESEIAPPSKMKEYSEIAQKHKELFNKENKVLREKFSEEVLEAGIFYILYCTNTEFTTIL